MERWHTYLPIHEWLIYMEKIVAIVDVAYIPSICHFYDSIGGSL